MENTITLNMENLSEDERKQLIKLAEKANKKENNKVRKPKDEEEYYYLYSDSYVACEEWDDSDLDENRYSIGNCFKTEEEAKFAVEKLKVIAELKRFAEENNECEINWKDRKQCKHAIYYDSVIGDILTTFWIENKYSNGTYFTSDSIAIAAINKIGEDRLKKYYFEIED